MYALTEPSSQKLKVYGINSKSLNDFVTTDKDIKKGVDRLPMDDYLIKDDAADG